MSSRESMRTSRDWRWIPRRRARPPPLGAQPVCPASAVAGLSMEIQPTSRQMSLPVEADLCGRGFLYPARVPGASKSANQA